MRGQDEQQGWMFIHVSADPIRAIRALAMQCWKRFGPTLNGCIRTWAGPRPIRSQRRLMEQMDYNLLYRWFVGLRMDEPVWDASSFSKNRERLLQHEISVKFFQRVLGLAKQANLLSAEHFSVDGTLIEAWAGRKNFQPRPEPPEHGSGRRGELQKNETHAGTTDPDARLYKKSFAAEPKLSHFGHVVSENRHGLVVATRVTAAG
jgi:hypothetical protein